MARRRVPMAPVDAAWYHIDGPVNLAQVTGMVLTPTPLDFRRVRDVYRVRLRQFERFRQRVVETGLTYSTPEWEDIPDFDLGDHVHHVALPAPHDEAALRDLVSDLASTPLDRERPLWQIHVIDGVGPGSALIMRFHHCIGDGTAMMAVVQSLFDASGDTPLGEASDDPPANTPGLLEQLFEPLRLVVDRSASLVAGTVQRAFDVVQHPERLVEAAGQTLAGAGMLVGELLKPADSPTPLKGSFGMPKRVAWSEPVPLDVVKAIGARYDAKVNDVLVAAVAGALRAYLTSRGVDVDRLTLRAMVPVDLRAPGRALDLGNEFGLVILDLAVSSADPVERLRMTRARMDALKRSPEAAAILTLFNIFGRVPKVLEDIAVDLFSSKASLVLTNVAGPRHRLFLAGTPIERVMFWVPHPGERLGMGISILSYNGVVSLAVVADAGLVPDPGAVTDQFHRAFEDLRRAGVAAG